MKNDIHNNENIISLLQPYIKPAQNSSKSELIIIFGLLGDFDSLEYAQKLVPLLSRIDDSGINLIALGIGTQLSRLKFCSFTGFPVDKLLVFSDNKIHRELELFEGPKQRFGSIFNFLLMCAGISSPGTVKEVIRGYLGDKNSINIYSPEINYTILKLFKISGSVFDLFGNSSYLRPFELATHRLNNMIEVLSNWNEYIFDVKYLPQRGATFLLENNQENIAYSYYPKSLLCYSSDLSEPLSFLEPYLDDQ